VTVPQADRAAVPTGRSPFVRRLVFVGVVGLSVGIGAIAFVLSQVAAIASGFFAKQLCSAVFVAGRDPREVAEGDLRWFHPRTAMRAIRWSVDPGGAVHADLIGIGMRRAEFRGEHGCALVPPSTFTGTTANTATTPPRVIPARVTDAPSSPFPWTRPAVVPDALSSVVEAAFTESSTDPARQRRTRAIVIVRDGELLAERYAAGFDQDSRLPGWSIAKSVTHALVGALVKDGRLQIDAPVPIPAWRAPGDPRGAITWEHLLRLTSGLAFDENYVSPFSDVNRMLWLVADAGAYAAGVAAGHPPGRRWAYDSGTTNVLLHALRQALERDPRDPTTLRSFLRERILEPIGAAGMLIEADAGGTPVGSSFIHATAREYTRFGWLYANDGVWAGTRLLPEGWLAHAMRETPGSAGHYGAHFWIGMRGDAARPAAGRTLPPMLHATGFAGQVITIVPSARLVIVRLGHTVDPDAWNHDRFVVEVLDAVDAMH